MGGEIIAARAEVSDLAEFADRAVPPVRGRDEGLKVDELVRAATLAVRTGNIIGLRQGGRADSPVAQVGALNGARVLEHCAVVCRCGTGGL